MAKAWRACFATQLTVKRNESVLVLVQLDERLVVDGDVSIRHCPWVRPVIFLHPIKNQGDRPVFASDTARHKLTTMYDANTFMMP